MDGVSLMGFACSPCWDVQVWRYGIMKVGPQ